MTLEELEVGVSANVVAVRGDCGDFLLKQARSELRVEEVWSARVDRAETEADALRVLGRITPGVVPRVIAHDAADHVVAMELLPSHAQNWQMEIGAGRVWPQFGSWAGEVLAAWHVGTSSPEFASRFAAYEAFEELRLRPFHEAVAERRPEVSAEVVECAEELRAVRRCVVDGDYAPKNMLVTDDGRAWVVDLEVAHFGNPVFDLAFFLSFVALSAVRWPALAGQLQELAERFLLSYQAVAGAPDRGSITKHTACLMLARTDGVSPAPFLNERSRDQAREIALQALRDEGGEGLWTLLR
jgi:5-methylthioribose kinase